MKRAIRLPISWNLYSKLSKAKCEFESTQVRKISWKDFTDKINISSENINDFEFQRRKKGKRNEIVY